MGEKRKTELTDRLAVADAVRLYAGDVTDQEREAILARKECQGAYGEVFDSTHQLIAELDAVADEWVGDPELMAHAEESGDQSERSRSWVGWTIASAAAILLSLVTVFWDLSTDEESAKNNVLRYVTRIGEQKEVTLSDGSILTLNTASQVLVDINPDRRRIVMDRGEAYFSVAKDPVRPFSVELAGQSVTALGTQFNILLQPEGFHLAVTEGEVAIHRKGDENYAKAASIPVSSSEPVSHSAVSPSRIAAGTAVEFDSGKQLLTVRLMPEIQRYQAWRTGLLSFRGVPLSEVVAQLNRYSVKKIHLEGESIGSIPVFAAFKIDRIDLALKGLEDSLPVRIQPTSERILILPGKGSK